MAECTICGTPTPDEDACCADCTTVNFPPHKEPPLPWWQAARLTLAPNRDGVRALARREEPPDAS